MTRLPIFILHVLLAAVVPRVVAIVGLRIPTNEQSDFPVSTISPTKDEFPGEQLPRFCWHSTSIHLSEIEVARFGEPLPNIHT
jgi:hypothetical protein